ncbi:MAG: ATP-dependent DNA helicase RecQ [Deltaproteobacteria bacterium]|nr:ATP-dependent DNA helicase RecQ [Deltaproteobacteria bacterium]
MLRQPIQIESIDAALAFMQRVFGYHRFRPGQEEIVTSVLDGRDTLVIMPTGGGKSLCYQIPAFIREGVTLVISPLIALMKDQMDALRVRDMQVTAIHSLMTLKEQEEALTRIITGEVKLVYASPERLRNQRFIQALKQNPITMVAVDEAHCISQWGHDFRPDYLRIAHALQALGRPQTIALTATATEKVRTDIITQLQLKAPNVFITGFDRRNLYWEVAPVHDEEQKTALLKGRLEGLSGAAIIYTGTRKKVESIAESLRNSGLKAEAYHAGLDKDERTRVQDDFMEGRTDLVVATNAFGMGIDRSDIRMVVHHTFPGSIEAYYQESGRAGRDGEPATCLLLYNALDRRLQEFFIESRYPPQGMIFEVWNRLRKRPEDVIWLTYREIGLLGEEKIADLTVGSCVKILEDAGVLSRLQRYDNQAELYLHQNPEQLLKTSSKRIGNREKFIQGLQRLYDDEQLTAGIQFLTDELAEMTGLTPDALRRCLGRMEKAREVTFIAPFRGRGLRILNRVEPERLVIDYQALQIRKANELEKLDQVMAYASNDTCRRHYLLGYFGESLHDRRCGACDLCDAKEEDISPEKDHADPILAVKILSGVARLKERFGMGMAAKVLTGSDDRILRQFGLQRLSTYGLLSEYTQSQILEWIKELTAKGCIVTKRINMGEKRYPVAILTDRGRKVMSGQEAILLTLPVRETAPSLKIHQPLKGSEKEIFERLRNLRTRLAKEERLPSYCIFQDRTLREMARILPATPDQLLCLTGVGEVTLRKYGLPFLELLKEVRGENEKGSSPLFSNTQG